MKASIRKKIEAANAALKVPAPTPATTPTKKRKPKVLDKSILPLSETPMAEVPPAEKKEVLSLERMMLLRVTGLTYAEIGRVMGCSEENVIKRLSPFKQRLKALTEFQGNKGDVYDLKQHSLLEALTPEKIEDMKGIDLIKGAAELEAMGRKVRGLDMHQNVNIFSITVRAAHALPPKKLKEVGGHECIEGERERGLIAGGGLVEIPGGVRGTGLPEDVREVELQEVPRNGESGFPSDESGEGEEPGAGGEVHPVQLHGEGTGGGTGSGADRSGADDAGPGAQVIDTSRFKREALERRGMSGPGLSSDQSDIAGVA